MAKLFGTDGVRGVANTELSPELAFRLGRAGAAVLAGDRSGKRIRMVVGRDTRLSGDMLEGALAAGMTSAGADVVLLGVVPTPGVAFLTRQMEADGGAVISASHNPVEDNGIKFFSRDGFKLPDDMEDRIEDLVLAQATGSGDDGVPRPTGSEVGSIRQDREVVHTYGRHLQGTVDVDLSGMRIVVDCANGAASRLAPGILGDLGADVVPLSDQPNGVNINVACGSTHPEALQEAVGELGAHVGFAYDGDADRVIAVDEQGELVNGDRILAICGLRLLRDGRLPENTIAATLYSNMGLRLALEKAGGHVLTTQAGDRHVLEAMRERGLALGGEQSGHIIFLEHNTTGDGILTTLQLLQVMRMQKASLSELASQMQTLPQVLVSVRVSNRDAWNGNHRLQAAVARAGEALGDRGRIVVRPSGTEPVVRVMGEGEDEEQVHHLVHAVAAEIQEELG